MTELDRRRFAEVAVAAVTCASGVGISLADDAIAEISHKNAAIHQEIVFSAKPARIYDVLTITAQFDKVVRSSAAMTSMMNSQLGSAPTQIDARPGGALVLFGGYVTGRNIELVPGARIVQAWRAASWPAGDFSIAKFVLADVVSGTRLVFDHTGFPSEAAEHLAQGWHENYWQPLEKVLARL